MYVRLPRCVSTRPLTIGAHPDCDLVLSGVRVSEWHAVLLCKGWDAWQIRDLDSHYGIWDGEWRIREAWIDKGSELFFGDARVSFT